MNQGRIRRQLRVIGLLLAGALLAQLWLWADEACLTGPEVDSWIAKTIQEEGQ